MVLSPASLPRSPVTGQPMAGSARSVAAASPAPSSQPAAKLEPSQGMAEQASGGQLESESAADHSDQQKAETLRALISNKNMQLTTYYDDASGRSVLEVRDQATGKVVNQYPSDELLRLSAALREPLVDQSA